MTSHLLHIGCTKTGSSYLQQWFAEHPQLAYEEWGIAGLKNVFDVTAEAASPRRPRYRVTSFQGFALPLADYAFMGERPADELIPKAAVRREVCRILHDLFPDARVLLVTRGFREMILSTYSELIRQGSTFGPRAYFLYLLKLARRGEHAFPYDEIIRLYRDAFGPQNVIILPYELLREAPEAFFGELVTRLGLAPAPISSARIRPALSPDALYWYPRITRLVRSVCRRLGRRKLYRHYLDALREGRLNRLAGWLGRLRAGPPLDRADVPDALVRRCRGSADLLRELPQYAPYRQEYLL
jgi:sulfotransferase family protein